MDDHDPEAFHETGEVPESPRSPGSVGARGAGWVRASVRRAGPYVAAGVAAATAVRGPDRDLGVQHRPRLGRAPGLVPPRQLGREVAAVPPPMSPCWRPNTHAWMALLTAPIIRTPCAYSKAGN